MIIVVTGASGFIGRNLLEELRRRFPEAEIRRLVRTPTGQPLDFPVDYQDPESLLRTPALEGAAYLFHVAGVTRALTAEEFRRGNVLPVRHLLDAVVRRAIPLRRFLLVSSQAAAGPSRSLQHLKTEQEAPEPLEEYGRAKLEAEELVRSSGRKVPFTIVRPGVVFGPYDVEFLNIFRMTRYGLNLYPGYRHRYVSYVYVLDLVRAMIEAACSDRASGKTYFICNDRPATWQEIHETIVALTGTRAVSINIPSGLLLALASVGTAAAGPFLKKTPLLRPQGIRISRPDYWIASNRLAREELHFAPQHTLADGLRLTCAWYRQAGLI